MGRPGGGIGGGHRSVSSHSSMSSHRSVSSHRSSSVSSRPSSRPSSSGGFGSGGVSRPSRPMGGSYTPPPPRPYYGSTGGVRVHNHYGSTYGSRSVGYSSGRSSGWAVAMAVFIIVIIAVFIVVLASGYTAGSTGGNIPASTVNRERLDVNSSYQTDNVTDGLSWIDTSKVSKELRTFYDKTGIQPALVLAPHIIGITGNLDAEAAWGKAWYDKRMGTECGILLVYFDTGTDEEGNAHLVYGDAVKSVMDAEAEEIFWAYYDRYWLDNSVELTDAYPAIFNKTADRIMQRTTTGLDVLKTFFLLGVVVVGVVGVIIILKIKRRNEAERAAETEAILQAGKDQANLGTSDGGDLNDLKDRYDNM